jgi:DNA replication protein DnaC
MQEQPMPTKPVTIRKSVDGITFGAYHRDLARALYELEVFAGEHYREGPRRWLTLTGPSGIGKTLLGRMWAQYCKSRGKAALWATWPILVSRCADERCWDYFGTLQSAPFLILDDLGAEAKGLQRASKDNLAHLLYARRGKSTLITSNLNLNQLGEAYEVRLADRMIRDGSRIVSIADDCVSYSLKTYER